MGLAINGNTVHGLAVGGQSFVPEDSAGMPDLIGKRLAFGRDNPPIFYQYDYIADNDVNVNEAQFNINFKPIITDGMHMDFRNRTTNILAEGMFGPNTTTTNEDYGYLPNRELFLGLLYKVDGDTQQINFKTGSMGYFPYIVWVKYSDVKDYIQS